MKVTNTGSNKLSEVANKKADKAGTGKNAEKKSFIETELSSSSEVELSPRAKDMQKIKEVAKNSTPDVDDAKVAKFQRLIDSGQYKVDAKSVADRLVDEHLKSAGADTE
jgi:negative regulator of flagellin synthesis FlgM